MQLNNPGAEIFVPDGVRVEEALARTTHLAVGAHQDDLEIMAYRGILECFQQDDKWFCGVNVTNGAGSPRDDLYKDYTDEMMQVVRRKEQKKAAVVGDYGAQIFLDYSSSATKDATNPSVKEDLKKVFLATRPQIVYTHNLADKHDTHIAVTLRVIAALRELPDDAKPQQVVGCEVWRDLDWMVDTDKVAMDVSPHENLAAALLGVFDSQICGGKRYDLATVGRRRAHATYAESHGVDVSTSLIYGMDLTPLIHDPSMDVVAFVKGFIDRFAQDVQARIGRVL